VIVFLCNVCLFCVVLINLSNSSLAVEMMVFIVVILVFVSTAAKVELYKEQDDCL